MYKSQLKGKDKKERENSYIKVEFTRYKERESSEQYTCI